MARGAISAQKSGGTEPQNKPRLIRLFLHAMLPKGATPTVAVDETHGGHIKAHLGSSASSSESADFKANLKHLTLDADDGKKAKVDAADEKEGSAEKVEEIAPVSFFKLFR